MTPVDIIQNAVIVVGVVGLPMLLLYLRERVRQLAREETEKALQGQRHQHEQALAAINADHQRRLQEFGLYSRKQHRVYATLYAQVREAADRHAMIVGISFIPDFASFGAVDVERYASTNEIPSADIGPILAACSNGPTKESARLMVELELRVRRRDADLAFTKAKNTEALQALYLSDAVTQRLHLVRRAIAAVSAQIHVPSPQSGIHGLELRDAMDEEVSELHKTMRDELRRGGN